jgi:type IX secretion system PorP/SprF family membrane protein
MHMQRSFTFFFGLLFFFLGVAPQEGLAQDPRFTQFYAAPSQLNPAMTGVFEGRWRFHANYRDQWSSILESNPFRTVAAGFDMRYHVTGDDYFGVGLSAVRDEGGTSHFNVNRAHLSASYMKHIAGGAYRSDDQYLIAGGSFGFGQHTLDNRLWYSQEFNYTFGLPDPQNLSSGEVFEGMETLSSDVYMDVNAGLMYYALFGDNTSIYVGGAMNHLNAPNVSLLENMKEELYTRWIAHAGGELPVSDELSLMPGIQLMGQGPSFETTIGNNFRYTNHDWRELAIRVGLWTRVSKTVTGSHMDALIATFILEMERWNLGVSYDMTTSSLNRANNSRGALELSLIYVHPTKSRLKVNCPKF